MSRRIDRTRSNRAGEVDLERMRRIRLQVKASWWKLDESEGQNRKNFTARSGQVTDFRISEASDGVMWREREVR